ncbi:MAG: recombinase family protein [Bacteriovoracaceae bacterium]
MRELRDKGYSYGKIAEIFNSMKIPTKTKRGKWHSKSVYNILMNSGE